MRYASMRSLDISNGENIGVSLFVQGCDRPHCYNCFNPDTWDFNNGKKWTKETENCFMELMDKPYIKRVSILGGEPLSLKNCYEVFLLCTKIKNNFPDKKIWIYSGYKFEDILNCRQQLKAIICADVLVDGEYKDELRSLSLKYRGSSNQRVIDVQESIKQHKVVLYCD